VKIARNFGTYLSHSIFVACTILGLSTVIASANTSSAATQNSRSEIKSQFVIADFDGDDHPDFATVQPSTNVSGSSRYLISFHLSKGPNQILGVEAPVGGLQIALRDVNGDSFADVVVTTAWTNLPVAVLLNDGAGNFRVSSPADFPDAFLTSEKAWAVHSTDVKDACALLLSRQDTAHPRCVYQGYLCVNDVKLITSLSFVTPPNPVTTSHSGRAPPFLT
jgi:hypothetical protein